jgi:hypothetical protein
VAGDPRLNRDRPSQGRIMLRRAVALVAVLLALGVGIWAVLAALPHVTHEVDAPPTVAVPPASR